MEYVIESSEQGLVQNLTIVGGCNDDAVRIVSFDELEKTVENAAHFTDVVVQAAFGTDGIKLVKEIDTFATLDDVKDLAQLGTGFSHELGDKLIHEDRMERQVKFAGNNRCSHGLTGARRTGQKDLTSIGQTMFFKFVLLTIFSEYSSDTLLKSICYNQIRQTSCCFRCQEEVVQVSVEGDDLDRPGFGFLNECTNLMCKGPMSLFCLMSGNL